MTSIVYLVPSFLHEGNLQTLPPYIIEKISYCQCLFVENERSARRYLKLLQKQIIIENFEWFTIGKAEDAVLQQFTERIRQGKNIGIISEAGCPGIADPGQLLVSAAHELNAKVIPLVGPSSILLALMASGLNGQQFCFHGYLPIETALRNKTIRELEAASKKNNSTQIFIETPYRNNQLIEAILANGHPNTRLCIAANITAPDEWIRTKTIREWKPEKINCHKIPTIFLLKS